MNPFFSTLKQATNFGKFRSKEHFFSFILKCLLYIIPAVFLGNITDAFVYKLEINKLFGDDLLPYILTQTFIDIITLYFILFLLYKYSSEFQVTLEGGFFSVLYFGIQTNYINMIKVYLNH